MYDDAHYPNHIQAKFMVKKQHSKVGSPLNRVAAPSVDPRTQNVLDNVKGENEVTLRTPVARPASPLANAAAPVDTNPPRFVRLPFSEADIEKLGEDNSSSVAATTNKITEKFTVNNFDGLGDILTNVQIQADSLDMSEYTKTGILGKLRRGLTDVRKVLYKRMTSAKEAFDDLETKIANQIAKLSEWNKDLALLYQENYNNHMRLTKQIQQGVELEAHMKAAIERFPAITADDPDAFIKSQQLQEAQTLLNLLQQKVDTWRRLQIICESHGPNIQSKQMAGRNAIDTLKRLMNEMIPMVKMEFAMHLQTLEIQKTIRLVDTTTELGNSTLTQSADASRNAAIAAAKSANTPMISTQTLNHIRTRMLEAATGVNQIRQEAQAQREADAQQMKDSQAEYLKQLQQQGAV